MRTRGIHAMTTGTDGRSAKVQQGSAEPAASRPMALTLSPFALRKPVLSRSEKRQSQTVKPKVSANGLSPAGTANGAGSYSTRLCRSPPRGGSIVAGDRRQFCWIDRRAFFQSQFVRCLFEPGLQRPFGG